MSNDEIKKELQEEVKEQEVNPVEEYVQKLNEERQKMISGNVMPKEQARPDFLLPQFKNVEEQAKSYKELQALQTKQAQELAQLKKIAQEDSQKNAYNQKIAQINEIAISRQREINDIYNQELENLKIALRFGKISENEAIRCVAQLKNFTQNKLQELNYNFKNACSQCEQPMDMVSPSEYFQDDLTSKNYLAPVCEFLEKNYKKLSKNELGEIKNLVLTLENSMRNEILNENQLQNENENYRMNLTSATNLNPQTNAEKIFTLEEIKNMKPEEFRKNQQTILEQFVSHKIK